MTSSKEVRLLELMSGHAVKEVKSSQDSLTWQKWRLYNSLYNCRMIYMKAVVRRRVWTADWENNFVPFLNIHSLTCPDTSYCRGAHQWGRWKLIASFLDWGFQAVTLMSVSYQTVLSCPGMRENVSHVPLKLGTELGKVPFFWKKESADNLIFLSITVGVTALEENVKFLGKIKCKVFMCSKRCLMVSVMLWYLHLIHEA